MNCLDDTDQNDPKKILKEWVSSVRAHAYNGKEYLYRRNTKNGTFSVKDLDHVSDEFASIIGMCDAIKTVLESSG